MYANTNNTNICNYLYIVCTFIGRGSNEFIIVYISNKIQLVRTTGFLDEERKRAYTGQSVLADHRLLPFVFDAYIMIYTCRYRTCVWCRMLLLNTEPHDDEHTVRCSVYDFNDNTCAWWPGRRAYKKWELYNTNYILYVVHNCTKHACR